MTVCLRGFFWSWSQCHAPTHRGQEEKPAPDAERRGGFAGRVDGEDCLGDDDGQCAGAQPAVVREVDEDGVERGGVGARAAAGDRMALGNQKGTLLEIRDMDKTRDSFPRHTPNTHCPNPNPNANPEPI